MNLYTWYIVCYKYRFLAIFILKNKSIYHIFAQIHCFSKSNILSQEAQNIKQFLSRASDSLTDRWFNKISLDLMFVLRTYFIYLHTLLLRRLQRELDPTVGQSKTFLSDKCVLLQNFPAETSCEWATYFLTLLFFVFNIFIVAFTDPTIFLESIACEETVFLVNKLILFS